MKAVLAFYQGNFNSHQAEQLSANEFKITISDSVNQLYGSFIAVYNDKREMIDVRDDSGMQPAKRKIVPQIIGKDEDAKDV